MPTTARNKTGDTQAWRDLHWLLNSPSLVEELAGYPAAQFSAEQLAGIQQWMNGATWLDSSVAADPESSIGIIAPSSPESSASLEAQEASFEQRGKNMPAELSADLHTQFRRLGLYAEALLRTAIEHTPNCQLLLQHFPIQEDLINLNAASGNNTDLSVNSLANKPLRYLAIRQKSNTKQSIRTVNADNPGHRTKQKRKTNKGRRTIGELDYVWRDTLSGLVHHWELAVKLYLYIPPHYPPDQAIQLLPPKHHEEPINEKSASALHSLDRFVGTQRIDTLYRKLSHLQAHQLPLAQHPQVRTTLQQEINQSAYYIKGWLFYPLRPQHADDWSSYYLPEPQVRALLNPQHLRGWWLLEDEFEHHLAPQEQANAPWRWKILPRLQWLSPHRCAYAETLTGTELWQSIQAHWAYFKEKEETPQPQLVVALREDSQTSGLWHEAHRGFVVPSEW